MQSKRLVIKRERVTVDHHFDSTVLTYEHNSNSTEEEDEEYSIKLLTTIQTNSYTTKTVNSDVIELMFSRFRLFIIYWL